jgi:prepilin-type N-terminal cleavage/methylation domain-containing protein
MSKRGFTLLETLIYIALFGVLMTGALVTVYELLQSFEYNRTDISIQEEGMFIQRKIHWALQGATAITLSNPTTLVISRPDLNSESPLTIRFFDGKVYFKRAGSDEVVLTGDVFIISEVQMTVVQAFGNVPTQIHVRYEVNNMPFMFSTFLHF